MRRIPGNTPRLTSLLLATAPLLGASAPHDVVIDGGTPAAVTAAVQVIRMGHTVITVCPELRCRAPERLARQVQLLAIDR